MPEAETGLFFRYYHVSLLVTVPPVCCLCSAFVTAAAF